MAAAAALAPLRVVMASRASSVEFDGSFLSRSCSAVLNFNAFHFSSIASSSELPRLLSKALNAEEESGQQRSESPKLRLFFLSEESQPRQSSSTTQRETSRVYACRRLLAADI